MFLCLNFKIESPSTTWFGLYFAYEEYCSDDSNSPAERTLSPAESCLVSTVPLDCWSAEITGTLDSQSEESCSVGSPVPCR